MSLEDHDLLLIVNFNDSNDFAKKKEGKKQFAI